MHHSCSLLSALMRYAYATSDPKSRRIRLAVNGVAAARTCYIRLGWKHHTLPTRAAHVRFNAHLIVHIAKVSGSGKLQSSAGLILVCARVTPKK